MQFHEPLAPVNPPIALFGRHVYQSPMTLTVFDDMFYSGVSAVLQGLGKSPGLTAGRLRRIRLRGEHDHPRERSRVVAPPEEGYAQSGGG